MTTDRSISEFVKESEVCRVIGNVPIPSVTDDDIKRFRKLCKDNLCGSFGASWTCPPHCGPAEECMAKVASYRYADVLIREFRGYDVNDEDSMEEMMDTFRSECREIKCKLIDDGADVMAFADGPCRYCGDGCSVKKGEECPFPVKQVPSVSGYGIDMRRYIESLGESFTFSKDRITLYGIFLFK